MNADTTTQANSSRGGTGVGPDSLSVLMLDGESPISLWVARCLAQIPGVRLHALSKFRWAPLRFSRHCRIYRRYDSGASSELCMDAIRDAQARTQADVIFPVEEPAVRFAADRASRLRELAALPPVPSVTTFEQLTNKWCLAELLKENEIPGPRTLLATFDEQFHRQLSEFQFPVLLKPIRGRSGKGIRSFDAFAALSRHFDEANIDAGSTIVQELIPGHDVDCSVLCRDGRILASTVQRGFIPRSGRFAPPAGIEFVEDGEVLDVVGNLVADTCFSGVAHVDLRYDERDEHVKIVEVNARYWGSLLGSLVAGVNFPYLACLAALDMPFPEPKYHPGRFLDFSAVVKQFSRRVVGLKHHRFRYRDTALKYILRDPLAEFVKLARQVIR